MENGFVILGIIALFFGAMYFYSYYSVYLEKLKRRRDRVKEMQQQDAYRQEKLMKQQARAEKLRSMKERSAEIKLELMRLAKMKEARANSSTDDQTHQVA